MLVKTRKTEQGIPAGRRRPALFRQAFAGEAPACARSRKCEEELEELWLRVVTVETEMRRIHWAINGEWCVPPLPPHPGLADPWNWPDEDHYEGHETSESDHLYPEVNQGDDVIAFRTFTVNHFCLYIIQLPIVEEAWELYNRKLLECAALEETWQLRVDECDVLQTDMNDAACEHCDYSGQSNVSILLRNVLQRMQSNQSFPL